MKNKKEQIQKMFINNQKNNDKLIKEYDARIGLFSMCSKKNKNLLTVINTLGISTFFAFIVNITGALPFNTYLPIICLGTSVTLGSILTIIKKKKYKKNIDSISMENPELLLDYDIDLYKPMTSTKQIDMEKSSKQMDEQIVRYCIEREKVFNRNEVLKTINSTNTYSISNEVDYRNKDELLNSILHQEESIKAREEKLDIMSSKKALNDSIGYNKVYSYLRTTIFSLVGVFSVCCLPSIGSLSNDIILECLKISLLFNIPINVVSIVNLVEDNKLYKKINEEIKQENSNYKLELKENKIESTIKKLSNELYG